MDITCLGVRLGHREGGGVILYVRDNIRGTLKNDASDTYIVILV